MLIIILVVPISYFLFVMQPSRTGDAAAGEKVVILSLDGFADWIMDYMLEQDLLPNIKRVLADGARARHAYTTVPAKTAVGHSSIWTGTTATYSGILANSTIPTPFEEHTCAHTESGFLSKPLRAEPLWSTLANQDYSVTVVQATQNAPFEAYLPGGTFEAPTDKLLMFDGYEDRLAYDAMLQPEAAELQSARNWQNLPGHTGQALYFSEELDGTPVYYLVYDDPQYSAEGLDSVAIATSTDGATIAATVHPAAPDSSSLENWSEPVRLEIAGRQGFAYYRLFSLDADGSNLSLFRSSMYHMKSTHPKAQALMDEQGGFIGNDSSGLYGRGAFGDPVVAGGGGSAEEAYLETTMLSIRQVKRNILTAMNYRQWDLLIGYLAYPDSGNHAWLGLAAEEIGKPGFNTDSPVWPWLLESYKKIDAFVGEIYDALPEGATLVLVSDHGFVSVDRWFNPNVVLRQAGLLEVDEEGGIIPGKSRAVYYPGSGDFVLVNRSSKFRDGIVSDEEAEDVLRQVEEALLAVRDEDGGRVVSRIMEKEGEELHLDGPLGGDLYFQVSPRYYNSSRASGDAVIDAMANPRGMHFGDPRWRPMNSICAFVRKGSRLESELGVIPSIDLAPTICTLLGAEAPANSRGTIHQDVVRMIRNAATVEQD